MDRLEVRRIHPGSIPGLVPMILGVALMVCAVLLFAGARTKPREETEAGASLGDLGIAAAWSVFYAVAMVGNAPFALATAIYIAAFVWWFTRPETGDDGDIRRIVIAIAFGAVVSVATSVLFRYGFLVRLP
jgi:putative tricarboxylic transport membrane protein